jgi:7-cyano-7-deazaguanine synthase
MKKAVLLLSGGLDSATVLYFAKKQGFKCFCLIFDYGQRHRREIQSAKAIAKSAGCQQRVIKIFLPWKGSALLDKRILIAKPENKMTDKPTSIPATYVPGRNIIFLSFALSYAEAIKAEAVFIGAHAQDYSGYPDCRPGFFRAFEKMLLVGTKAGIESRPVRIEAPLLNKNKAEIIQLGRRLKVPFELTWSCYNGQKSPCGRCQSCYYRAKGFAQARIIDPGLSLKESR